MQELLAWLNDRPALLVLFIILARITDVSLGTMRTICVVRGYRVIAACLGFVEVLIWVTTVSGVLAQVTALKVAAYAMGFALGNAVGIEIESRVAMGHQMLTFISGQQMQSVAFALRMANYEVTEVAAHGESGELAMCFVMTARRKSRQAIALAKAADADVSVIIQDVRENKAPATSFASRMIQGGSRAWHKKK